MREKNIEKRVRRTMRPWLVVMLTLSLLPLAGCGSLNKGFDDAPTLLEGEHIQRFGPGTHHLTITVPEDDWRFLVDTTGLKYLTGRE